MFYGTLSQTVDPLCERSACNCTKSNPYRWITATCVFDNKQVIELVPASLPNDLQVLEVANSRELRVAAGSFFKLRSLQLVRFRNIGRVIIKKEAFLRLLSPQLKLEVTDVGDIVVETQAFKAVSGPVSISLSHIPYVTIQKSAFAWYIDIVISHVPRLELHEYAFSMESPPQLGPHGPVNKIVMDTVIVSELPANVFATSAAELSIVNSEIRTVRANAFSAIQFNSVILRNTSLHHIENSALRLSTLINTLRMDTVRLHSLAMNAIQSGVSHLVIYNSKVYDVYEGAFNITVATVELGTNLFERLRPRSFVLKSWNRMIIENNTFKVLDDSAFCSPYHVSDESYFFRFTGNVILDIGKEALGFTPSTELDTKIENNVFANTCYCDITSWLRDKITGSDNIIERYFNTSMCHVNSVLAHCFGLSEGYVNIRNFTEFICGTDDKLLCEAIAQNDASVPAHIPGMTSDIFYDNGLDREKKVLGSIFIFVICSITIMMALSGLMWFRRNGYCTKARLLLLPSTESFLNIINRIFSRSHAAAGSAHSITRVSVHEYAELQAQKPSDTEDGIPSEDKATQTLPEELTQELLQTLREKLDDPENYSEARDMIEHLYDLIKVEESCNQNYTDSTLIELDDVEDEREGGNVYDVIKVPVKPKIFCVPKEKKSFVSVGTRAPSPDKLLPVALGCVDSRKRRPAIVCDYTEPKDRQLHLYSELGGGTPPPTPARPLSFLRSISETILPSPSILCDYTEPTDTAVHVYSELPNGMADRPLPNKPDQKKDDPGEGPSNLKSSS